MNSPTHGGDSPAPVSGAAAAAFAAALPRILAMVNDKFAIETRVLGGHSPSELDLIKDSHSHFGDMLRAVYEFDLHDHVTGEFGWYISSLSSRGFEESYFRRMLEAWMIAIHAAIKPPESGELTRLLEYLCRSLHSLYTKPEAEPEPLSPEAQHFLSLLLKNKRRPAAEYALEHASRGEDIGGVYAGLILPALGHVGLLWQENAISVADEHAATEIGRYVLFRLIDSIPGKEPIGRTVMVACVPGEQHDIGIQIAGGYLEASGWDVIHVGRSAPKEEIVRLMDSQRPQVAVFSIHMLARLPAARELFYAVRERFKETRIIAGGRAAVAARKVLERSVDAIVEDLDRLNAEALRQAG